MRRAVLWWHGAWAGAVVAAAMGLSATGLLWSGRDIGALAAGAAPGVLGLLAFSGRRRLRDSLLMGAWTVGGTLAALLTGGAGGPLVAWCLAPLAAAAMLRRGELAPLGAALSLASVAVAALSAGLLNLSAPAPALGVWMGLLAVITTGAALGASLSALLGEAARARAGRDQLQAVAEAQQILLLTLSAEGRVHEALGAAPEGLAMALEPGFPLVEAAAPDDRPALREALRRAAVEGSAEQGFAPDQARSAWVVASLRACEGGRLAAAIRDGSAQRAYEASLIQARETAESQNAGKSRFLANMSHELRTPLNAIMGFSDIMRQRLFGPMSDRYGEYAELVHESGRHLLELINDVLDMSKIEAERFELALEEFDARDAVSAVLRLMRGQADRAGVNLRGVLPREPLEACADRRALKQIALNLISNALKFTPKGGSVTVTLGAQGDTLELIVADTGVGVASEDLERLGRPFEQAGDVEVRAGGTGLGLSLVKAFAGLHGGEMSIESVLGEGTSVTVRMPVLSSARAEPVQATG